jgi:hypothetical protein
LKESIGSFPPHQCYAPSMADCSSTQNIYLGDGSYINICDNCDPGFYFYNSTCVECGIEQCVECEQIKNPVNPDLRWNSCLSCEAGYINAKENITSGGLQY